MFFDIEIGNKKEGRVTFELVRLFGVVQAQNICSMEEVCNI